MVVSLKVNNQRKKLFQMPLTCSCIIFVVAFCAVPALAEYSFEFLVEDYQKYIASEKIQSAMRHFEKEEFKECIADADVNSEKQKQYFISIPLNLGGEKVKYCLILPSECCFRFCGRHAFVFWILCEDNQRKISILYKGRNDGLEILNSNSNGLFDLQLYDVSYYGVSYTTLKYNGHKYIRNHIK